MEEEVQGKTGFDLKKYLPIIGIVLAVIVLIIVLVSIFGGGPKKAVKNYLNAMSSMNASKLVNSIDFAAASAWKSSYDVKDFSKDDYKEFVENYKDVDKDDVKAAKELAKETFEEMFDGMKDEVKSFKMKVEKVKSTEKLGKDLYAVKATVSVVAKPKDKDEDAIDETTDMTFIVYKNKVIPTTSGLGLGSIF